MDSMETLPAALKPFQEQKRARSLIYAPGDDYWYHRPALDFPPRNVRDPADHGVNERLSLAITQTTLKPAQQKALVREWCALLPTLANVRTLWFHTKVTQEIFEAACAMPNLEGLYIKWSAISSLAPIAGLKRLAHLHLGGAPSATHIEALSQLPALVSLDVTNVRAAGDLRFLRGLTKLRELWIGGDSNSLKPLLIESLAPLTALRELELLTLTTVRLVDGSLAPLAELPRLIHLGLANMFPMEEYAWLAGRRPDIQCDRFEPSYGPNESLRCKACGQYSLFALTGKGKPWLCQHCDAERLALHNAGFRALVKAAAVG
jgi:hypothetical protein